MKLQQSEDKVRLLVQSETSLKEKLTTTLAQLDLVTGLNLGHVIFSQA